MFGGFSAHFLRPLGRQSLHAAISILGFGLGLCCFALVTLLVRQELAFEDNFANAERIYRATWRLTVNGTHFATFANGAGPEFKALYPQVTHAARIGSTRQLIETGQDKVLQRVYFADADFAEIFDLKLLHGSLTDTLASPASIALSRTAARRYFGTADAIGQRLRLEGDRKLTVTAIFEDLPANTHFTFHLLAPMAVMEQIFGVERLQSWGSDIVHTYLLIDHGADMAALEASFPGLLRDRVGENLARQMEIVLQPLKSIHFNPGLESMCSKSVADFKSI